jgi:ribonuclease HI
MAVFCLELAGQVRYTRVIPTTKPKPTVSIFDRQLYGPEHREFEAECQQQGFVPVELYVDGSCPIGPNCPDRWSMGVGIVAVSGIWRQEWGIPLPEKGTNQIAELEAIKYGLSFISNPETTRVRLYSDSEYAIGILTQPHWRLKCNVEIAAATNKVFAQFPHIEVLHVEGHKRVEGNKIADRLAGTARKEREIINNLYRNSLPYTVDELYQTLTV